MYRLSYRHYALGLGVVAVLAFSARTGRAQQIAPQTQKADKGHHRLGLYGMFDVNISEGLRSGFGHQPWAVGIEYATSGKFFKYHAAFGYRKTAFANEATIRPATFGYNMEIFKTGTFALGVELLVDALRIDAPIVSINGSGVTELSSGFGAQVIAKLSDRFYFSLKPLAFQFRYLAIGGGSVRSDLAVDYPISFGAGFLL